MDDVGRAWAESSNAERTNAAPGVRVREDAFWGKEEANTAHRECTLGTRGWGEDEEVVVVW